MESIGECERIVEQVMMRGCVGRRESAVEGERKWIEESARWWVEAREKRRRRKRSCVG